MNITVLTPEEEILAYFRKAMVEELPAIINKINEEQGEIWIEELKKIGKIEMQNTKLPQVAMSINKIKKKIVDINFIKEEYLLNMTIKFKDNEQRIIGYRYNYLINKLIKTSADISMLADKIIIEEMEYKQNQRGDNREPASITLKIIITKETS